jgi:hypothetical protein
MWTSTARRGESAWLGNGNLGWRTILRPEMLDVNAK